MTDREKLSDLMYEASKKADAERYIFDQIADHLIANGVTVQNWIPVADRLPEESGEYLAITANCVYGCLGYSTKHKAFNASDYIDNIAEIACTHWMPLPQPPEGE